MAAACKKLLATFDPFEIVVIGTTGVGKTNLIEVFAIDLFKERNPTTVHKAYPNETPEGYRYKIWDTEGRPDLCKDFVLDPDNGRVQNAAGVVVCYAVNNRASFDDLIKTFIEPLKSLLCKKHLYLVGCQNDLTHERKVTLDEGKKKKNEIGMLLFNTPNSVSFYEVSARSDSGAITTIFDTLSGECQALSLQKRLFQSVNDPADLKLLLQVCNSTKHDINQPETDGRSLVHVTTNPKSLKMLINAGAKVSEKDDSGETALQNAIKKKRGNIVKMISDEQKRISRKSPRKSRSMIQEEAYIRDKVLVCPGYTKISFFNKKCKWCRCTEAQHTQFQEEAGAAAAAGASVKGESVPPSPPDSGESSAGKEPLSHPTAATQNPSSAVEDPASDEAAATAAATNE